MIQLIHTPMLAKMRQTFGGKRVRQTPLVLNTNAHLPKFLLIEQQAVKKRPSLRPMKSQIIMTTTAAQEHGAKICLAHA
jgi:hypothetical protein